MGCRWAAQGRCRSPGPSAKRICFHSSGVIYELPSAFWQTVVLRLIDCNPHVQHSAVSVRRGFIHHSCIHQSAQPVQSHLLTLGMPFSSAAAHGWVLPLQHSLCSAVNSLVSAMLSIIALPWWNRMPALRTHSGGFVISCRVFRVENPRGSSHRHRGEGCMRGSTSEALKWRKNQKIISIKNCWTETGWPNQSLSNGCFSSGFSLQHGDLTH